MNWDFTDATTSINDSVDKIYYDPEVGHVSSLGELQAHTKNDEVMVGWTKVGKGHVSPIADKVPQRPNLEGAGGGDTVSRRVKPRKYVRKFAPNCICYRRGWPRCWDRDSCIQMA